ncbi:hypothetical protein KJ570_02120 [Patescibacteria group bacterium]|nr:hypothetical protein [Patescibacteria group bacterium]
MEDQIIKANEIKVKSSTKPYFFLSISILILILGLVIAIYLVQQRTYIKSKAYSYSESGIPPVTSGQVSLSNSYVFASPIEAISGGEYIRITVFVLDQEGSGIVNKKVAVGNIPDLLFDSNVKETDAYGKAFFDVKSSKAGTYIIEVAVEGKALEQRVKISFR